MLAFIVGIVVGLLIAAALNEFFSFTTDKL